MFVDFEQMPDDSRIWIYQADRAFSESEKQRIYDESVNFLTQWTAHGNGLKSSANIFYDRFLVITVDEKQARASGCSIDTSVNFVRSLGKSFKTDFFNRTNIAFLIDDKVVNESLDNIKKGILQAPINSETLTFNNLIQSKSELKTRWIIPVSESWLRRYFKTQKV